LVKVFLGLRRYGNNDQEKFRDTLSDDIVSSKTRSGYSREEGAESPQ
jgi:hypothetical protein